MAGGLGGQVVVDHLGEAFDVDAVAVTRAIEPFAGGIGRHVERLAQGGYHIVAQEIDRIALFLPAAAVGQCEGGFEAVVDALGDQVALHVGDVRRVARVAELFVEDANEDLQDGVALGLAVGLGVDVEQDHIGRALHRAVDVGQQHGVCDFLVIEERSGQPLLAGLGMRGFKVFQQVRQDLDEVGFAGAEKARYPDTHAVGHGRIVRAVDGGEVGIEEATQMLADLLGDDVLFELLPDAGGVHLVGFDDAIDGAVDRFEKELLDVHFVDFSLGVLALWSRHGSAGLWHEAEGSVVVVFGQGAEQAKRVAVVPAREEHQQRRLAHHGVKR